MQNSTLKLSQLSQFSSSNVNSCTQGVLGMAIAGNSTNIDFKLTDDCFITGGVLITNGSTFGDKATFQVVDKDNVLGYGANTILGQYCTDWYMCADRQLQLDENIPYPAKIFANLYLRIIYTSIGTTDIELAINYKLHKVLY